MFKIREPHGGTLCSRCRKATVVQTDNGHTFVHCSAMSERIYEVVRKCSDFKERGSVDLDDLYTMAWMLRTDKKTRKIGFQPPEDHPRGF